MHEEEPLPAWLRATYAAVCVGLVAMAGLMSGLTLGLMSLDEVDLEVWRASVQRAVAQARPAAADGGAPGFDEQHPPCAHTAGAETQWYRG